MSFYPYSVKFFVTHTFRAGTGRSQRELGRMLFKITEDFVEFWPGIGAENIFSPAWRLSLHLISASQLFSLSAFLRPLSVLPSSFSGFPLSALPLRHGVSAFDFPPLSILLSLYRGLKFQISNLKSLSGPSLDHQLHNHQPPPKAGSARRKVGKE